MDWKVTEGLHRRAMYSQMSQLPTGDALVKMQSSFVINTEVDLATKPCGVLLTVRDISPSNPTP